MKTDPTNKLSYIPIEKATADPTGWGPWELMEDRYWVVHPEKGLAFYDPAGRGRKTSPQCNAHESIASRLVPDGHEVRFIARAWMHHNCGDYA